MELGASLPDKVRMLLPDLPITEVIPDLLRALRAKGCAVLQAPPGAGKTTLVPLALMRDGLVEGRIIMLEPRRLATRAAAERMADTLGEPVGRTVGYRIRGEAKVSRHGRIEVVTEGILTRMLQSDPSLDGIGAVIFDEFHERSLNADLGLALVWEMREALRPDLKVLVMSATLDAEPVADMLGAALITSVGRAWPVDTRWLDRPVAKSQRFEQAAAELVLRAVAQTDGGVLVFLPGEGEIRRVQALLRDQLPDGCRLYPLFGAMPFAAQRAAIAPDVRARKIVLATSIAETSLTIQDISVVVDAGRARRARFDPGAGMSRLVTERVTKAEADQRRGRAGRLRAGTCWRMWTKGENGGLAAFPPAEIEAADLCALALELALWGAGTADDLNFLTPPNPSAMAKAKDLLNALGALDGSGHITSHGRTLAALPLHPRLGHMLTLGGPGAAPLAALLSGRDPLRGASVDLIERKQALSGPGQFPAAERGALERVRTEAKRLARLVRGTGENLKWAALTALAYPDRIGLRRAGEAPRWVLSGGKGAVMQANDPMAAAGLIVAADLDGDAREARIRLAIEISEAELLALYGDQIVWREFCVWSRQKRRVRARRQECFGALVLSDQAWSNAPDTALAQAALDGVRDLGLPWSEAARRFCARVALVRTAHSDFPDLSDDALMARLEHWLLPFMANVRTEADIRALDLLAPLRLLLGRAQIQLLDRLAPAHFTTPMGRKTPIDYSGDAPEISLRLQELFGVAEHPSLAGQPLRITLLSPAGRALQTTMDLPGFWASSYRDVRKDMRGRYPKHPWPEDPTVAAPTQRAKPRKR